MKGKFSDQLRLQHILDAIKTKDDFFNNPMYRFSVEKQLEIIGEAANNISNDTKNKYPTIPWEKIISFRNFLAHEYFGVYLELVWGIIEFHLPPLKLAVEKIVKETE
jgi:uncharacterized protein with HEPN domain